MQNPNALQIIQDARIWLGTPFKLQGRCIGVGVDCIGLIVAVVPQLQKFDTTGYSLRFQSDDLKKILDENLKPASVPEIGNILLMNFDAIPNHLAIYSCMEDGAPSIIHASLSANQVIEERLPLSMLQKIKSVYLA